MARPRATTDRPLDPPVGIGFLLSQLGAHAAARFAERLKPLGLKPAHSGILRAVRLADGPSQQALGERLGMFPSRLVGIIDEMEGLGLVERRSSPTDRRSHAVHLTAAGEAALEAIQRVSRAYQEEICAGLGEAERAQLASLLGRIAAEQGLRPGVHPALGQPGAEGG